MALHRGNIYLGTLGHPEYARPDILGTAVNTAFMVLPQALTLCPSHIVGSPEIATGPADGLQWQARGALFEPEAIA